MPYSPGSAIAASRGDGARTAERLGVQPVPKHRAGKSAGAFSNATGANPLIALLPDPSKADYAYWKSAMKQQSARRAAKRAAAPDARAVEPLLVDEEEPDGMRGGNDTLANAQLICRPSSAGGASRRRRTTPCRTASPTRWSRTSGVISRRGGARARVLNSRDHADPFGGTADDSDVDFGVDIFNPIEGFTGIENTAARTLWRLHS